ncbi:MAG TPA: phytanoyl-CoA dioxygenase family protein [Planctomycetota bacterium]|nr:phytanoyl-CoA dioxygenase family protein [Planctomycetota bacterium]
MNTAFDPSLATFAEADPARRRRRLTRAQVDTFNRDGWLAPLPGFDAAGAAANRAAFDRLLAEFAARGHDSYAINGYHRNCASIWDVVAHPPLVDYAVDLLGDDVVAWGAHYFCKLPGDGKNVAWHQDAPYWALNPTRTVTVWLAIDDVDVGNGAMHVIPGSHRLGALRMRDSRPEENNVLWLSLDGAEGLAAPEPVVLRAGECSLHSDLTVHGSPANASSRRRAGLAIRYAHASVRSPANWNEQAIIVAGSDPSGHWRHVPRPEGDRPFAD